MAIPRRLLVLGASAGLVACTPAAAVAPLTQPTPQIVYVTPAPAAQPTPLVVYLTPPPAPQPTPQIVYVTPPPTLKPSPTAKPTPRPTPKPTPRPKFYSVKAYWSGLDSSTDAGWDFRATTAWCRAGDQVVSGYSTPSSAYEYWSIDGLHLPVRDGRVATKSGREGWSVQHQGFVSISVVARCYG